MPRASQTDRPIPLKQCPAARRPWWNHSSPPRATRPLRFSPTVIFAEFSLPDPLSPP